jgi:hypothetical protein
MTEQLSVHIQPSLIHIAGVAVQNGLSLHTQRTAAVAFGSSTALLSYDTAGGGQL